MGSPADPRTGIPDPGVLWLIDKDPTYRETLAEALNRTARLQCPLSFATAEEAARFLSRGPQPDILLIGLLDDPDPGLHELRLLLHHRSTLQIVILTPEESAPMWMRAALAGAVGFSRRGAEPRELMKQLLVVLAGGTWLPRSLARRLLASRPQGLDGRDDTPDTEEAILAWVSRGSDASEIAAALHTTEVHIYRHLRHLCSHLAMDVRE